MRFVSPPLYLALPLLLGGVAVPRHPSVVGLRIHLFCESSGEFTSDITAMSHIGSWNLATGEGGAPCSSQAVLLVYIVEGEPNTSLDQHPLTVVVTRRGATATRGAGETTRQSLQIGATNADGRAFVPLLLNNLACERVQVGAQLGLSQALVTPLPFRCGT